MKHIPLSKGKSTIVDDCDYDWLNQWTWCVNGRGYAMTYSEGKVVKMHRLLALTPPGMECDHINHQKLDNRRSNLRNVTHTQNQVNRRGCARHNTSGFLGVVRRGGRFRAQVHFGGTTVYGGSFADPEVAAMRRDQLALTLHGEFATLNFN